MTQSLITGGALNALNDTLELDVAGFGGIVIQLSGTFTATITFEGTADGLNWVALNAVKSNGSTAVTTASAAGAWFATTTGLLKARVRCSSFGSGAIHVALRSAPAAPGGSGGGGGGGGGTSSAFGAAFPSDGTAAGFIDNTGNMAGGNLDASGNLLVNVAAGGAGGGAVTVAEGADVAEGATTDAKVTGDNTGTVSAKLRGLTTIFADVWDSVSHFLKVSVQNATLAVTQSGTWLVGLATRTSGGTSDYHKVSAATNNADVVKNSAGQVYGVKGFNVAAYPVYVKLFNKATNPDPSSDTVIRTIALQAGVRCEDLIPYGLPFATGIGIAIVKGIADNNNTAVAASDCVVDVDYA